MAESIHIKELNKGIRETVKGLREVTIKLTPLEEALPEVTQGIGKLEHGAEEAGSTLAESGKRFTKPEDGGEAGTSRLAGGISKAALDNLVKSGMWSTIGRTTSAAAEAGFSSLLGDTAGSMASHIVSDAGTGLMFGLLNATAAGGGIAASAASVIACAGDEVQVYPGSMVMIHGVAGLLYDYYTLADLKKLQKDFDASERAIAEIYHAKTGIEVDQLRSMMTRETWMVGQEAIDNGFADTLLTDEGPDVTLSADKKVLLVAGIRHDVKGFRHIPGTIPIDNSIHAAPAAGNKHAAAKNDGPKKEDNKTMTLEEMRAQHPDVVAQIEQQAAETARTQERARIEAIDSIAASVGDAQLVRDAKYGETPCTAEQLALKAMQKQAALGAKHLKDAKADNDESGAAGVGAAPNGGEEGSENDDKAKVDAIVGLYNSTKSQNGGKK